MNTITVLIPALNEEKNIGKLIADVLAQKVPPEFHEPNVLVISDGSTDSTNQIVADIARSSSRVALEINKERIGKIFSVGKGFHKIESDYLIMFDADVALKSDTIFNLCNAALASDCYLVAGNPIPFSPKSLLNVAEQASMFSWHLVQAIKKLQPKSIYSAHGRILMLKKIFYKNINIDKLSTPGDDQFIYLQSQGSFVYADNAIVFYKLPSAISDYLKQNVRFRKAQEIRKIGDYDVKKTFFINRKMMLLAKVVSRHPYRFTMWAVLFLVGFFKYALIKRIGDRSDGWGIASSTKEII
jgi:glycosyltransferase involved in cell wall biosynthesis